jgi:hypothetical protein
MIRTDAFVSDCDCVRKSRLRSKPLPFAARARDAAVRVLDHVEDDDGAVEDRVHLGIGAVRRRREALDRAHVRVHALVLVPVDAPWMKSGTLTRSRQPRSWRCAAAGFESACLRSVVQWSNDACCASVFSWLITTLYSGRPVADVPCTSRLMRPSRLRDWMSASVQPIA